MNAQQQAPATRVSGRTDAPRGTKRKMAAALEREDPAERRGGALQHAFTTTLGLFNRAWRNILTIIPRRLRTASFQRVEVYRQSVDGGSKRRAVGKLSSKTRPRSGLTVRDSQSDPGYGSLSPSASPTAGESMHGALPSRSRPAKSKRTRREHPLAHLYPTIFGARAIMKKKPTARHSPERLRARRAVELDHLLEMRDYRGEDLEPKVSRKLEHLQAIRNLPPLPAALWEVPHDDEQFSRAWNDIKAVHAAEHQRHEQPDIRSLPNFIEIVHHYDDLFPSTSVPAITTTDYSMTTTHGGGSNDDAAEAVNEELSMLSDAPPAKPKKTLRWAKSAFAPHFDPNNQWKFYTPGDPPNEMRKNVEELSPQYARHRSPPPTDTSALDVTLLETPSKFADAKDKSPAQTTSISETPRTQVDVEKTVKQLEDFHVSKQLSVEDLRAKRDVPELEVSKNVQKKQEQKRLREEELKRIEEAAAAERARIEAEKQAEILRKQKEEEEERLRKEAEEAAAALAAASVRLISALDEEWEAKVSDVLKKAQTEEITRGITVGDMNRLKPGVWLNDNIINAYLTHMVDAAHEKVGYNKRSKQPPTYHAFNTHFFSTISEKGPDAVHRWLMRAHLDGSKLLSVKKIFIPVNCSNAHWTLMVVSPEDRTIEYLDSLGSGGGNRFNTIKNWLRFELKDAYVESEWTLIQHQSPQQDNSSDCGAFVCFNSFARLRGLEPMNVFDANDMRSGRRQIAATILNKGFTGVFAWT